MKFHLCLCFRYEEAGILVCIYLRIMSCEPFHYNHYNLYTRIL